MRYVIKCRYDFKPGMCQLKAGFLKTAFVQ